MEAIISYILKFLIRGKNAGGISSLIGYTDDPLKFSNYRIVIIPSPFFRNDIYGTEQSMPQLPLEEIEGIPLLFGSPETEYIGDTVVIHADILASAYFLLTRYEEIRRRDIRDECGRFPGKESLPYKAGFIHRPVVDEYGKLLRKWLRQAQVKLAPEAQPCIHKIWLTHDVDAPFYCRTFRNLLRESIKGSGFLKAWKIYKGPLDKDPFYTFPWLLEKRNELKNKLGKENVRSTLFIKGGGLSSYDKPRYALQSKDFQKLIQLCNLYDVQIGLHASFDAGKVPERINQEKNVLEKHTGKKITHNRHHYLSAREPEDFEWLEKTGITDDFTMGYADIAGFRLGTSHPVNWIDPQKKRISSLILHPLIIMDCTLSEKNYMNLSYEEALAYCTSIIKQIANVNGDITLLWHNDTIAQTNQASPNWLKKLFEILLFKLETHL